MNTPPAAARFPPSRSSDPAGVRRQQQADRYAQSRAPIAHTHSPSTVAVTRAGCQDKPSARATRVGGNTQLYRHGGVPRRRHWTRAGADLALLAAGCHDQPLAAWPDPGFRRFRQVQYEWEETVMHLRYLWAKPPEIPSVNVDHVQVVLSRVAASPPSRRPAARKAVVKPCCQALLLLHVLLHFPARKRPSPCRERALTCGN